MQGRKDKATAIPTVDPLSHPLDNGNPLGHPTDDGNSPDDMQYSQHVEVIACEVLSLAEVLAAAAPGKTTGRPQALGRFYPDGGYAASHHCWYTDAEREKEGIRRCNGPQIISILSKGVVYHEVPDKKE